MVKVKGKAKGPLQEFADATASDSKPSDFPRPDSPEVEESSVRLSKINTESSTGIETFAEPSAKRAKLRQQLAKVERQVRSSYGSAIASGMQRTQFLYDTVHCSVDH